MDGWALVSVLALVGFALMIVEIFIPGMIVGIIGLLCCLASVGVAFSQEGTTAGWITLFCEVIIITTGFFMWMRLFPHTPMGRQYILGGTSGQGGTPPGLSVGDTGVTVSALRPTGLAEVRGQRFDVVSENAFIPAGNSVTVVQADRFRIVVRAIS
jgi:membrane-bound ClpP family serine protease